MRISDWSSDVCSSDLRVLYELGAEVVPIGVYPDGFNINQRCGATDPARMQEAVVTQGADFGIALDGDADRVILADEKGKMVDGDQVMALVARSWLQQGRLKGGAVVATVMKSEEHTSELQSL